MTLVLTVNGPDTIWMLTDRRISFASRRPKEDGRKVLVLETRDGVALLGYCGLGQTASGTEPADWMSSVLRGRDLPLEQCLGELSAALKRQLPKHLAALPGQFGAAHHILVPAFVNNEPRLYSVDLALNPNRRSYGFRYTRHIVGRVNSSPPCTPRIALAGSGVGFLLHDKCWMRRLLKLVRACDRQRVAPHAVADYLASINSRVSMGTPDNSVGPRSIVIWRHKGGSLHSSAGAHQFYDGTERARDSPAVPNISLGLDSYALVAAVRPMLMARLEVLKSGGAVCAADLADLNAALERLPSTPDESLT